MMRQYNSQDLLIHPGNSTDPDVMVEVTPQLAGWDYISFQLRRLPANHSRTFATGERDSVFTSLPYAMYLPRHTSFAVNAESDCEYAVAQAPTDEDHQPQLVTPGDVEI